MCVSKVALLLLGHMSAQCIEDCNDIHGAGLPRGQKRDSVWAV